MLKTKISAKSIEVRPIEKRHADRIIKRIHYSGKVVNNSQLSFGVFLGGKLLGAMQYGPPTDKSKLIGLVKGTKWNGFFELNRLAFSDRLPKFSESRAISLSFKWMKKEAQHIGWVISFADGCQCGHGTIYQASNFRLTQIKKNTEIILLPNGVLISSLILRINSWISTEKKRSGISSSKKFLDKKYPGWRKLKGYMLRYIYFLNKQSEKNFTGQILPFSKIREMNAEMVRGKNIIREV